MKKYLFLLVFVTTAGLLFSGCGSSGNNESSQEEEIQTLKVKPKTTAVKGDLSEYFEVVDREYTIKKNESAIMSDGILSVEVKRTDVPLPFDPLSESVRPEGFSGRDITTLVGFGLELFDENGEVVEKKQGGGLSGAYSHEDIIQAYKLKPGETGTIRFSVEMKNKPAKFILTSSLQKVDSRASDEGSSTSSSSITTDDGDDDSDSGSGSFSSKGSEDWDKVLDAYERYVDKYIVLMKKANNGDASAMAEYVQFQNEAQNLNNKLARAKSDLSASQLARMNRINNKMLKAAQ